MRLTFIALRLCGIAIEHDRGDLETPSLILPGVHPKGAVIRKSRMAPIRRLRGYTLATFISSKNHRGDIAWQEDGYVLWNESTKVGPGSVRRHSG